MHKEDGSVIYKLKPKWVVWAMPISKEESGVSQAMSQILQEDKIKFNVEESSINNDNKRKVM